MSRHLNQLYARKFIQSLLSVASNRFNIAPLSTLVKLHWEIIEIDDITCLDIGSIHPSMLGITGEEDHTVGNTLNFSFVKLCVSIVTIYIVYGSHHI